MTTSTAPAEGRRGRAPLFSLAWRESRTARRRLLLYMSSISIGVAALVAIDSFATNIVRTVRAQSRALFGGDIVFGARDGWTPGMDSLFGSLRARGITITKATSFVSMVLTPSTSRTRLSEVRAVGDEYPLYGEITTVPAGRWQQLTTGRYVIADPGLLAALGASVGDSLSIGFAKFEILAAIGASPSRSEFSQIFAPTVFVSERYVPDMKLLVAGSRADYDAYARIPSGSPARLVQSIRPILERHRVNARSLGRLETGVTAGIGELSDFLGLVGIVALLLGGIGVASGVHAWVMRKIDTVAVLRCLGATSRQVMTMYVAQAAVMGLIGAAIGAALGVAIQFLLPNLIGGMLPVDVVVQLEPRAIAMGMALGLWIALAFALRPLIALRRVSPLQALRRNEDPTPLKRWWRDRPRLLVNGIIALSVVGLAATRSPEPLQIVSFSAAIGASLLVLAASALVLSTLARRLLRGGWPYVVRQGVANLYRPGNQTRSVVLSLGFGAFLVTTLYLVQNNLLAQFRRMELEARGNLVFFDVQDDQISGVDSLVAASGTTVIERVPLINMRVAAINGRPVATLLNDSAYRGESWALRREYRSTYRDRATASETILTGKWFDAEPRAAGAPPRVSLEREVAAALRVKVGDMVTWNVQGTDIPTLVSSIREVNWQRFEPNFFAVFEPVALERAPKMFVLLTQTTNDSAVSRLQGEIVRRYPNVASIDLSVVRRTVSEIARRGTLAVRFLTLFSLAMAVPVLFSAVSATRRDRVREGVLLKTLGATRRQISRILFSEYALLGILGSLTGMILSYGGAWLLMRFVFERPFVPAPGAAAAIAGLLLLLTVAIGLLAGRDVFRETPMAALREA